MQTAVINIKVEPKIKKQAQKVAAEMGLSLSRLIDGFLHQVIKTKTVTFSASEEPSDWMIKNLEESRKDIEAGRVSPSFSTADEAIAWLNDFNRKYANQNRQKVRKKIR